MHPREMHPREMHPLEMHPLEMHPLEMHPFEMQAPKNAPSRNATPFQDAVRSPNRAVIQTMRSLKSCMRLAPSNGYRD